MEPRTTDFVRPELINTFSCYLVVWQLDWSLKYAKLQFSAMWSRLWWFNIRKSFIFCQIYICSITDPWSTQSCPDRPGHNFQPRSIYWIEHLEIEFKNETFQRGSIEELIFNSMEIYRTWILTQQTNSEFFLFRRFQNLNFRPSTKTIAANDVRIRRT